MRVLLVLASLLVVAMAQRGSYAGSGPKGRPELASRFRDPDEVTTQKVYNRFGQDGTTIRIPVDARGDGELVDRLSQWDREHQPFWLLNAQHIENHRNPQANPNSQTAGVQTRGGFNDETIPVRPTEHRSSFLGARN